MFNGQLYKTLLRHPRAPAGGPPPDFFKYAVEYGVWILVDLTQD